MNNDIPKNLNYNELVSEALTVVVKKSLLCVKQHGFSGEHHFYITFLTGAVGVDIPEFLLNKYPNDMTIVIQHQFYDLQIFHDYFQVSLSFNKQLCRLTIPFRAVISFMDPAVNFRLILHPNINNVDGADGDTISDGKGDDSLIKFTPRPRPKEIFKEVINEFKTERPNKTPLNNIIKLDKKRPKK